MNETTSFKSGICVTPSLRLVKPLGAGGMGCVWIADHLALETQVAVKFLLPGQRACDRLIQRLSREASIAARLRNPHAVQVFDFGRTPGGSAFIVMELLEGESLEERLNRTTTLSPLECGILLGQVGKLLHRAHQLDIIHRDLKPANLFLCNAGYDLFAKVLDFGVAKQLQPGGDQADSLSIAGTPYYMSPEAIRGGLVPDAQTDLWALAVVAYRCLVGQLPFAAHSFGEQAILLHEGVFVPPSVFRADLPRKVDAWFSRAFAKHANMRFRDANEMVTSFLDALEGIGQARSILCSYPPQLDPAIEESAPTVTSQFSVPAPPRRRVPWTLLSAMVTAAGVFGALSMTPSEDTGFFARQALVRAQRSVAVSAAPMDDVAAPEIEAAPPRHEPTRPAAKPKTPPVEKEEQAELYEYW